VKAETGRPLPAELDQQLADYSRDASIPVQKGAQAARFRKATIINGLIAVLLLPFHRWHSQWWILTGSVTSELCVPVGASAPALEDTPVAGTP
jgi:hypothetical protein